MARQFRYFLILSIFLLLSASLLTLDAQTRKDESEPKEKTKEELAAEEEARKIELLKLPNFVLIIADDMGWDDSSPYGHKSIMTPNLQRLADEGMRFDNAYLTISSCSPSRASIITGRYPHNTDAEELHWPLPKEQITFVEKLKEKGYWTAAAGKWHLGDAMKDRFNEVREVDTSGFQLPTGAAGKKGEFKESLKGDAQSGCSEWISLLESRPEDQPFFLWLAALDPHRPYREGSVEDPARADEIKLPPYHPDTRAVRADYQGYYDEITRMDKYLGKVLDTLTAQQASENTVVIFISDNGRPFTRDKTTLYDSGIKTPLIIRWPKKIGPASTCPRLVSSIDLAPTILELAGFNNGGPTFQGRSFVSLLKDPKKPIREYIFAEKNWHDYEDHARAVRNERYKYIRNYYNDLPLTPPADAVRSPTHVEILRLQEEGLLLSHQKSSLTSPRPLEELYDTKTDPYELENLVGDERFSSLLRAMRVALVDWEKNTEDSIPKLRTADEFDRSTGAPNKSRVRPRKSKKEMIEAKLTAP